MADSELMLANEKISRVSTKPMALHSVTDNSGKNHEQLTPVTSPAKGSSDGLLCLFSSFNEGRRTLTIFLATDRKNPHNPDSLTAVSYGCFPHHSTDSKDACCHQVTVL